MLVTKKVVSPQNNSALLTSFPMREKISRKNPKGSDSPFPRARIFLAAFAMFLFGTAAYAQLTNRHQVNIESEPVAVALKALAAQTGVQVLVMSEDAGTRRASAVVGNMTIEEALAKILHDTGLTFQRIDDNTVAIKPLNVAPAPSTLVPVHQTSWHLAQVNSATSADSAHNPGDYQLEEIVVTAEGTAISLTAISGADLQAQGVSAVADAARQIPGVAQASAGPGQTEYTIRGLSSPGAEVSTVGFYLDDVPMTAPSGAQNGHVVIDPDLYDLNRIEVLRGPQGTLYGSGSMGGTIKLVTNQPNTHEFSASAKVDGSGTQGGGFNRGANAMVNVPLIEDMLAVRIVATDEHTSGWIDRIVLGDFPLPTNPQPQCAPFAGCSRGNLAGTTVLNDYRGVNDEDLKGIRASVRYQPTDQLTVTATAFYQSIAQDGLSYYDNPPGTEAHYQPFDVPEPFSDTFRMYNVVGDLALTPFTITSATSYWTRTQSQTQDVSETYQTLFDLPAFGIDQGGVGPAGLTEIDYTKQLSEEIRLTSNGDAALQWLVGGFYSDYHYSQDQYSLAEGFVPLFGSDNLITAYRFNHLEQTAEFGEVSYTITPGLKATVGARHYSYTQEGSITRSGIVAPSFTPTTTDLAAQNSGINPKFTLSYDVESNVMVYGTAAKGFRPGAGNTPVPTTGADSCLADLQALGRTSAPSQYDPDTVWSYEVGEKTTLLDKRLTVNSAI
jgi:iron complex outermembrane recepter protein